MKGNTLKQLSLLKRESSERGNDNNAALGGKTEVNGHRYTMIVLAVIAVLLVELQ